MRDTSIFQGIKELSSKEHGESFRFEKAGEFCGNRLVLWRVFRKQDEAFVLCGQIEAHPRTSNKQLFKVVYQLFVARS